MFGADAAPQSVSNELQTLVEQVRICTSEAQKRFTSLLDAERADRDRALADVRRGLERQQSALAAVSGGRAEAEELQIALAQERQETLGSITAIHSDVESLRGTLQAMRAEVVAAKACAAQVESGTFAFAHRLEMLEHEQERFLKLEQVVAAGGYQDKALASAAPPDRAVRGAKVKERGQPHEISSLEVRVEAQISGLEARFELLEQYRPSSSGSEKRLDELKGLVDRQAKEAAEVFEKLQDMDAQLRRKSMDESMDVELLKQKVLHAETAAQEIGKQASQSAEGARHLREEVVAVQRALQVECERRVAGDAKVAEDERRARVLSFRELIEALQQGRASELQLPSLEADEADRDAAADGERKSIMSYLGLSST